jgi:branched-chain amino acid transport system substrate-binding protein
VDFAVVQTYSFIGANDAVARRVTAALRSKFGVADVRAIDSPGGVAHAYDLTHILARAIDLAGSTDRRAIRAALEQIREYRGLVKHYAPPFTPSRHEALGPENVFLARFEPDGAILRLPH